MTRLSKIIGLALGPKSFLLAEVAAKTAGTPAIQKLAEFPFPDGQSLATPNELGVSLAAFLRAKNFTLKDVIIGLPAKRLLTRRKDVPPASDAIAASTLRLQAETEFAGEADPYAIDFAGKTSTSAPSAVMLVATAQSVVDQCNDLAKAAGLKLRGITATSAALGRVTSTLPGGDGLVVSLAAGNAELVVQHGKSTAQLRHLAVSNAGTPESMNALVGEIRRTVASLHQNGTPLTLALWDDAAGDSGAAGSLLREKLNMPVSLPELRSIAVGEGPSANGRSNAYAPAVAVALAALDAAGPPVDFLHSRLAPPKERSKKRPLILGISAAALVVLLLVAAYVNLSLNQSYVDNLTRQHYAQAKELNVAQIAHDHLKTAREWTDRPRVYDKCLTDLTNLFPDGRDTIWATNFDLALDAKGPFKGTITGKAVNEDYVRALVAKMVLGKQFVNPTLKSLTSPDKKSPTATNYLFTITFDDYQPVEKK